LTVPFALVGPFGWSTVIYALMIAYILFGIEEIGVEIENPFGTDYNDLPLEEICGTIERDLVAIIEEKRAAGLVGKATGA
jgi:putative membrane protein